MKRIAISIGDPNGIGPEISLKATQQPPADTELLFVGDRQLLEQQAASLGLALNGKVLEVPGHAVTAHPGQISAEAGAASFAWVERGIDACLQGEADALVTAPISKQAWMEAGLDYPGHTELLAERCGTNRFGMMLMGKGLRVFLATRHLPLKQVAEQLSEQDIRLAVDLLQEALPLLGAPEARIALCGLNPHAGDGGAIGMEEQDWILPLAEQIRQEGASLFGPLPADTVFHQAVHLQQFDAVIALYHDQGLGPLKLWAFDEGVNLTLGLPLYRCSPDHGTAFAIAGQGLARADSMQAALDCAASLCNTPNPWTLNPSV